MSGSPATRLPPDPPPAPAPAPGPSASTRRDHPFVQLFLARLRIAYRDPDTLIWGVLFPTGMALVLALAFRPTPLEPTRVAVSDGPGAAALVAQLSTAPDLAVELGPDAEGLRRLGNGSVSVLVRPSSPPTLVLDPTRSESRSGQLQITAALRAARGDPPAPGLAVEALALPGTRYVDFLIPGLLAMNLMLTSTAMVGTYLARMRNAKLLKRLAASPMPRGQFYVSLGAFRLVFAAFEIFFFVLLGQLAFEVPVRGSYLTVALVGLAGGFCWSMISLVIGLLARSYEGAVGMHNLVTTPMIFACGVFFSAERFPDAVQPLLDLLPLTAMTSGLRAVMLDGAGLASLGPQFGILAAWTVVPLLIAVRFIRWR